VHRATEIDFSSRAVFMAAQNEASILASSSPIAARKPDRFFTVIKFWMDETSGVALALKTGVPSYPSRRRPAAPKACRRREEGRTHLLIHLPIEEDQNRLCLWRPDHAGFDSRSIFERAMVEK
jgi:hypothetical protein